MSNFTYTPEMMELVAKIASNDLGPDGVRHSHGENVMRDLIEKLENDYHDDANAGDMWDGVLGGKLPGWMTDVTKEMPLIWYALRTYDPRGPVKSSSVSRKSLAKAEDYLVKAKFLDLDNKGGANLTRSGVAIVSKIEKFVKDGLKDGATSSNWKNVSKEM